MKREFIYRGYTVTVVKLDTFVWRAYIRTRHGLVTLRGVIYPSICLRAKAYLRRYTGRIVEAYT